MASIKHVGNEAMLYDAPEGTVVTTGALIKDSWYRISAFADTGSTIPALRVGSVFKTPEEDGNAITLATGDEVFPLTLAEICRIDTEISSEKGVIDTTDSCDEGFMSSVTDGYVNMTGSINTMLRFDKTTDEIVSASEDLLNRFFDFVEDDGEGTYVQTDKNDDEVLLMILLNSTNADVDNKVENWMIVPAILSSASTNIALKDADKADYSWSKGQGPVSFYKRTVPAAS